VNLSNPNLQPSPATDEILALLNKHAVPPKKEGERVTDFGLWSASTGEWLGTARYIATREPRILWVGCTLHGAKNRQQM
jgi:hypothetical protein